MAHRITFHPFARDDLFRLYAYIEERSGPARAGGCIERIERRCNALRDLPNRGAPRDDLGPGVRTVSMEGRVLIAYRVHPETVEILRVFYAGWDVSADDLPD